MKRIFKLFVLTIALFALTACGGTWQVESDLDLAQQEMAQAEVERLEDFIENYDPTLAPETEEEADYAHAPIPDYIDLARAYESLGDLDAAMDVYRRAQKYYDHSQAIESNIGKLYEKAGLYKKAAKQYRKVMEQFQDTSPLYDIVRMYILLEDAEKAEIVYGEYLVEHTRGKRDPQFEQQINQLKGIETTYE